MHLNIFVSQKCFLSCKGCYSVSREEKCGSFVATENIVDFLQFVYANGVRKVTLCGGDPLTRDDILELLKEIKNIGYSISLDTVGTALLGDVVRNGKVLFKKVDAIKLAELVDVIGIPIDGSNNDIFKLFRQTTSDIFEEQLQICDLLHRYGANICINTVVHKGNLNDVNKLSNVVKKLDYINKWQLFQFAPLGKYGTKNRNLFEIGHEQFQTFKSDILKNWQGDDSKLQFKDLQTRNKAYMLIDNLGNAWTPLYEMDNDECNLRKVVGNINKREDWEVICSYLEKSDV